MWLVLLLTFVTVSLAGWLFVFRSVPSPAEGISGPRPITRSQAPLDQTLARLQIPLSSREFLTVSGLAATGAGLVAGALIGDPFTGIVAAGSVVAMIYLDLQRRLRQLGHRVIEQLPDTLMMLANSLKVGHSLIQSFQTLGEELPPPLGSEFARTVRDLQLGQGMEEALEDFKQRVGTVEADMLVQAILIQRETGGNLVEILNNLQGMLRERLKLQGKVRTLTAQGKLSGLVIGILPFGLLMFLWVANRPYLMEFVTHPMGMQLMMMAAAGQILGVLFIRKIVNFPI